VTGGREAGTQPYFLKNEGNYCRSKTIPRRVKRLKKTNKAANLLRGKQVRTSSKRDRQGSCRKCELEAGSVDSGDRDLRGGREGGGDTLSTRKKGNRSR